MTANDSNGASEPHHWAWLVGLAGLGLGNWAAGYADESHAWAALGALIAFAGGWAWQASYRRDLADRLQLLSWLLVVAVIIWGVLAFVPGVDEADRGFAPGDLTGFCGLVAGLVLAEQWLRRKDRLHGLSDR